MSLTGSLVLPINEYSWQLILKLCGLFDTIMVILFTQGITGGALRRSVPVALSTAGLLIQVMRGELLCLGPKHPARPLAGRLTQTTLSCSPAESGRTDHGLSYSICIRSPPYYLIYTCHLSHRRQGIGCLASVRVFSDEIE